MEEEALFRIAEAVTSRLPHGQRLGCTGFTASWCPIHGTCLCDFGAEIRVDENCPLHGGVDDPFKGQDPRSLLHRPGSRSYCSKPDCDEVGAYSVGGERVCSRHRPGGSGLARSVADTLSITDKGTIIVKGPR